MRVYLHRLLLQRYGIKEYVGAVAGRGEVRRVHTNLVSIGVGGEAEVTGELRGAILQWIGHPQVLAWYGIRAFADRLRR